MSVASADAGVEIALKPREHWLVPPRQAWFAFGMAFLLMTFDYIDRQAVVAMFPALKAAWGLSDKQLGALISSVSIAVAVFSFPISLFADRWSRVKSIAVMAGFWSIATIACGFTRNYGQLLAARSMIGLGEAGYGSSGAALLTSIFPAARRATVLGGFLSAASVGSVLGVILGGVVTARWGWEAAFGVVGIPGLVLALMFLWVRDYRTVPLVDAGALRMGAAAVVRALVKPRSALAAYLGGALQLLPVSTLLAWLPSYFNRFYGLNVEQAGMKSAMVILLASIGIVVWGYVADRMAHANRRAKMLVPAACIVMTALLLSPAFGLVQPGAMQFAMILAGGFMMTAAAGSLPSVAIDVIHPGLRATAAAMVTVVQNLFGLAAGPFIAGALSDAFGLGTALALMPLFCLASAAVVIAGARAYPADLDRADAIPAKVVV
ncbi:MFS transporter [Reyranella sp.]|jgi:MFS family permease|uniref:MFS transporter n=1 Tax=Reyranella sp. TaxID=1929291 RepID=UPI002F9272C5